VRETDNENKRQKQRQSSLANAAVAEKRQKQIQRSLANAAVTGVLSKLVLRKSYEKTPTPLKIELVKSYDGRNFFVRTFCDNPTSDIENEQGSNVDVGDISSTAKFDKHFWGVNYELVVIIQCAFLFLHVNLV